MSNVWFTSDHHFGHAGVIRMSSRPFVDVNEMDEVLIANFNGVVRPNDIVWHLGDLWYKSPKPPGSYFSRLNGTKHLVVGNHDGARTRELDWASVQETAQIAVGGVRLVMGHYPWLEWPGYWKQSVHLFGHVHNNRPGVGRSCDVGVDAWSFRPVSLDEILQRIGDRVND